MTSPFLTVLIPTHGRPALLKRTLRSLSRCHLPDSYQELVVIENGSRAGAEQVVADLPECMNARYMHRERGNKSYALNEALGTIDRGLAVFFDDDVFVCPDALIAYAEAYKEEGWDSFFGGPVEVDREETLPEWTADHFPGSVRGYDFSEQPREKWYLGCNWAADVKALSHAGGFNPKYGPGALTYATGQEMEMQGRLMRLGFQGVDVERAVVRNYVPRESTRTTWLLRRKFRRGIQRGLKSDDQPLTFCLEVVKVLILATGTLTKSVLSLDKHRFGDFIVTLVLYTGCIKGYIDDGS